MAKVIQAYRSAAVRILAGAIGGRVAGQPDGTQNVSGTASLDRGTVRAIG